MTNEEFYDTEIAPALLALADRCAKRNMALVAVVEYEPGQHGRTQNALHKAGVAMQMLVLCDNAGLNVDGYMINLIKLYRDRKIDFSNSFFLRQFA